MSQARRIRRQIERFGWIMPDRPKLSISGRIKRLLGSMPKLDLIVSPAEYELMRQEMELE
jgi:hypothetical protein